MRVLAHPQPFTRKPTSKEVAEIQKSWDKAKKLKNFAELQYALVYGHTVKIEQDQDPRIIILDIDKSNLTFWDALKRLTKIGVQTSLAYETFSSTPEAPRFRLMFYFTFSITREEAAKFSDWVAKLIDAENDPAFLRNRVQLCYGAKPDGEKWYPTVVHRDTAYEIFKKYEESTAEQFNEEKYERADQFFLNLIKEKEKREMNTVHNEKDFLGTPQQPEATWQVNDASLKEPQQPTYWQANGVQQANKFVYQPAQRTGAVKIRKKDPTRLDPYWWVNLHPTVFFDIVQTILDNNEEIGYPFGVRLFGVSVHSNKLRYKIQCLMSPENEKKVLDLYNKNGIGYIHKLIKHDTNFNLLLEDNWNTKKARDARNQNEEPSTLVPGGGVIF
ncbi:hypothetical protein [Mycoplasmopsis columboralis]|uniref:Uncharacterized protein n=1 Tax=Mycoplasmopsis columboralis TaxID=171282 RepID=A0A449B608_9BACT|nr:hypothetical protein [Mycoplasmopsis columboralis]VEU75958.1 Uncharacterised protein [Mycoplasmopsis columboralis]